MHVSRASGASASPSPTPDPGSRSSSPLADPGAGISPKCLSNSIASAFNIDVKAVLLRNAGFILGISFVGTALFCAFLYVSRKKNVKTGNSH